MNEQEREEFETACRAFGLFSTEEKARAVEVFARLRYPSARDRFFEAVHQVITDPTGSRKGSQCV